MSWVRERAWGRPLPVAERLGRTLLSLPMYPALTEGDVARVVSALEGALDEALAE
jgi:dTDP-4-amino-4,6-dideoxygalactose transaminase